MSAGCAVAKPAPSDAKGDIAMSNLFLDLDSSDTFDTALERMEEYGVGSILFTVKGNGKPILFLCLTQNPDLAALLGKTAEAYDDEQEDA